MRRLVLVLIPAVLALAGVAWFTLSGSTRVRPPIRVGLLHSLTGPMAISEASMVDAEKLAVERLNAQGGLLGRRVEYVVADGRSDWQTFGREAERLIRDEKVSVIVGCWTAPSRKAVKAVVEREDHLLIYPVAYEGLEQSPNIVYVGAAPNQQVIPTVQWSREALKAKTYFLVGTDSLWPHAVNTIIKDQLTAIGAVSVGEEYVAFGGGAGDVDAAVEKALKAKPDVILNTLEGDSNLTFFRKLRGQAEGRKVPVISFAVAEDELRKLPAREMTNDYLVCNYFQSVDRPENREFVGAFRSLYGQDRVTSDAIESAYNSVLLWAQAVREAESEDVDLVRSSLLEQSLNAPEGVISVDRDTQHTWRPFFVGRVRGDGQVEIVYTVAKPIRPSPYPFSRTRDDWETFLESLYDGWDGNWAPPAVRRGASAPEAAGR